MDVYIVTMDDPYHAGAALAVCATFDRAVAWAKENQPEVLDFVQNAEYPDVWEAGFDWMTQQFMSITKMTLLGLKS